MKKTIGLFFGGLAVVTFGLIAFFVFQKPSLPQQDDFLALPSSEESHQEQPPAGRCGDNICDDFETANPDVCPIDCQEKPASPKPKPNQKSSSSSKTSEAKPKVSVGAYDSPFGFHPANAEKYSYAKDLGAKWSREGVYVVWSWLDQEKNGSYKFNNATAPKTSDGKGGHQINFDEQWLGAPEDIKISTNICPFRLTPFNQGDEGFGSDMESELAKYGEFVKKTVERYDGDNDYGCVFSSPDCYKKGDNQYPSSEVVNHYSKNPIKYWQVCNQLSEVSETCKDYSCKDDYAKAFAKTQKETYESAKEADPAVKILIAGDSSKALYPAVFKELGGKYIDIVDFHRFGNKYQKDWYNPKTDFDYLKSNLKSSGFDLSKLEFWTTETGTYSGKPESKIDNGQPYQSESVQASSLLKVYVSGLAYGLKKIFWAWSIVEGFDMSCGAFDSMGLVYDGADCQNGKYTIGDNIGYDKGKGVKKLSYYTYKKMTEMLDGGDWNNIETVQEKDGVYAYKFTKIRDSRCPGGVKCVWQGELVQESIWVAWNDNDEEKQITISDIKSSSVKITEAVPKYESGEEMGSYETAFDSYVKETADGKIILTIKDKPVFVEER